MRLTVPLWGICIAFGGACASPSTVIDGPQPAVTAFPKLPTDINKLFQISDDDAAMGPAGPNLNRSLNAAEKITMSEPEHVDAHWRISRALFYQALAKPQAIDELLTIKCIHHGEKAVASSTSAPAHLFLALCMGVRAQFAPTEGLGLVKDMLSHAQQALRIDSKFDHAAAHRLLGGIYLKAPSWPTSVGDLEAAIEHLSKAISIAPNWPENHLLLAEAYYEEDEEEKAKEVLAQAERLIQSNTNDGWNTYFISRLRTIKEEIED